MLSGTKASFFCRQREIQRYEKQRQKQRLFHDQHDSRVSANVAQGFSMRFDEKKSLANLKTIPEKQEQQGHDEALIALAFKVAPFP
jgi:hypothetical protein